MIDQAGPVACGTGLAQHQPDARRARVNHAMHAFGAAIKAIGGAAAHLCLIDSFTIQAGIDHIGDLLNQLLEIAVV